MYDILDTLTPLQLGLLLLICIVLIPFAILHDRKELKKINKIFKSKGLVIETLNIETIFSKYKKKDINFKQDLTIQDWGHKSFSINDPNGVVLFFFENVE